MRREVLPATFYRGADFFAGLEVPMGVIHIERAPAFPPHRHDFTELVLVSAGSGRHESAGEARAIGPGDALLIPRGCEHSYAETAGLAYVNVVFRAEDLLDDALAEGAPLPSSKKTGAGPADAPAAFRLSAFALREALALVSRIDQELFRKEPGYGLMAKALFLQLWAQLAREGSWPGLEGESSEARVRRLVERIDRDPSLDRSVEDMAAWALTSPRNFRREFRRATGSSPAAYVARLRIEEARLLLAQTDKTVTQVALLVGFGDPAYFARAFKRAVGVSPRAYRAAHA